jgi:hypothetical protein
LYSKFESLGHALQYAYPDIEWNLEKFSIRGKKSVQRKLKMRMEALMPGMESFEDYKHPDLIWSM